MKSFILYTDMKDPVDELSDEDAGKLFKAIFQYVSGADVNLGGIAGTAFSFIRPTLARDGAKYQKKCETSKANGTKGGRPKKEDKDLFDTFWAAYPKKTGKKEAQKAFKKVTKSQLTETIIPDLAKRKKSEQWQRGYIPNPATYLRGERWNDDIPKGTAKTAMFDYEQREYKDSDFEHLYLDLDKEVI